MGQVTSTPSLAPRFNQLPSSSVMEEVAAKSTEMVMASRFHCLVTANQGQVPLVPVLRENSPSPRRRIPQVHDPIRIEFGNYRLQRMVCAT